MISRPPKIKIQQSMLRSYHAFAKSHPLIAVTFSTPTPDFNSYFRMESARPGTNRDTERKPRGCKHRNSSRAANCCRCHTAEVTVIADAFRSLAARQFEVADPGLPAPRRRNLIVLVHIP